MADDTGWECPTFFQCADQRRCAVTFARFLLPHSQVCWTHPASKFREWRNFAHVFRRFFSLRFGGTTQHGDSQNRVVFVNLLRSLVKRFGSPHLLRHLTEAAKAAVWYVVSETQYTMCGSSKRIHACFHLAASASPGFGGRCILLLPPEAALMTLMILGFACVARPLSASDTNVLPVSF